MKKLLLMALAMLCLTLPALADTLHAGPADSGLPSITEALAAAQPGDEILLAGGVYDATRETFPIMVDKAVTLRPADDATPVIASPKQVIAMKITGEGAMVTGVRFEHLRCAIWVLADDVTVTDCAMVLADETWRTSSSGLWIAGARNMVLTGCTFEGCSVSIAGPPVKGSVSDKPVLTAMFEVGEELEFFTTHTIERNTVNGEPLCYLIGAKNLTWTEEVGSIIAVLCEDVVFENLNVDFTSIGIQLAYCKRVEVKDCSASDSGLFGVYVMKSDDCTIRGTRADRCTHGIDIRDVDQALVVDCITNDCGQGTFLSWCRNSLVQRGEMLNNGIGFFSASGGNNHVDQCRLEDNDLGSYIQKEPYITFTNTQIRNNSVCGIRLLSSGVISIGNTYADNFVGNIALDSMVLLHMDCVFTNSSDCDMFIRNADAVKLIGNTFDGPMADSCEVTDTENIILVE